eukprot:TRINITY_DN80384_c0_g1_i1.p1 TRINITY_DN80384_c0_g1~~TRINITY_DN80384_c0_g1_i1.p1  ORF type:complete len:305 (+),score=68.40 TRINITY_DN80384_c0_g1_i1:58-972(+)
MVMEHNYEQLDDIEDQTRRPRFGYGRGWLLFVPILGFMLVAAVRPATHGTGELMQPVVQAQPPILLWSWDSLRGELDNATKEAERAADKAANSTWGKEAEREAEKAANKTWQMKHEAANSTWGKEAERAAEKAASKTWQMKHEAANSTLGKSVRPYINETAQVASDVLNNTKEAFNSAVNHAKELCGSEVGRSQNIMDQRYLISPTCQDAMEVALVFIAGAAVAPELIAAAGFTEEGVVIKSVASAWQSTMGDVEEGSVFARLQSAGARGILATRSLQVSGASAIGACAFCKVTEQLEKIDQMV